MKWKIKNVWNHQPVIMFIEINLYSKQHVVENARFPGTPSAGNSSQSIFQLISHSLPMKQLLLYPGKRMSLHSSKIIWTAQNHILGQVGCNSIPEKFPIMQKSLEKTQVFQGFSPVQTSVIPLSRAAPGYLPTHWPGTVPEAPSRVHLGHLGGSFFQGNAMAFLYPLVMTNIAIFK